MIALPSGSKQILYVTGMPRAGSTLLCQLLGMHPAIYSIGHSSPLAALLDQCRTHLSDNHFLLAQLDVDFDLAYNRLIKAYRGLLAGWFAETDLPVVVDKNRGWLAQIETVKLLDPQFNCWSAYATPLRPMAPSRPSIARRCCSTSRITWPRTRPTSVPACCLRRMA